VISWCFSLVPVLASHGVFALSGGASVTCLVAGSYGPFPAAFIALYREGGWRAMGGFARRALRWRIAPRCLLAALLLVPCLAFLAACVYARLGGPAASLAGPLAHIPMLFLVMLFMGGSSTRNSAGPTPTACRASAGCWPPPFSSA
jgi:hypothetical protein